MIFQEIYRNSFCLTINLELDEEILKIFSCVHLSLDPNTNKEMNFKNTNDFLKFYKDNLDLIIMRFKQRISHFILIKENIMNYIILKKIKKELIFIFHIL